MPWVERCGCGERERRTILCCCCRVLLLLVLLRWMKVLSIVRPKPVVAPASATVTMLCNKLGEERFVLRRM